MLASCEFAINILLRDTELLAVVVVTFIYNLKVYSACTTYACVQLWKFTTIQSNSKASSPSGNGIRFIC